MGSCVNGKLTSAEHFDPKRKSLEGMPEGELYILHLMYLDLAERIVDSKVNLQNFLLFFQKNGYWGESLFKQFGQDETRLISEQEFLCGMSRIHRSSEADKISLLFKFFTHAGHDSAQGIGFHNLLMMLYNYPKEDLRAILNDKEFIQYQLTNHLTPIVPVDRQPKSLHFRLESSRDIRPFLSEDNLDSRVRRKFASASKLQHKTSMDEFSSMIGKEVAMAVKGEHGKSDCLIKLDYEDKTINIEAVNIHQLAKQFARTIFREAKINTKTGKLNFQQFYAWISKHRTLYEKYYEGFHTQIWETDDRTSKPRFLSSHCEKSSQAKTQVNGKLTTVKLFLQHEIMVASRTESLSHPLMIVCLEGLSVRRIFDDKAGFGIEVSHRDGVYHEKQFFFKNEALLLEWLHVLEFYKATSLENRYLPEEKIGRGKFSTVYRCICVQDKQEYALKEIALFKLDSEARNLIAHETSIMQVVSHPLLLEFKECIQTKTHMYIVTQLVNGANLLDYVMEKGYLKEEEAAQLCQQLIVGTRYLHSLDIVHRDLKPENIMTVTSPGGKVQNIKIIDFGLSNYLCKLLDIENKHDNMVGTANYIAPEVLKEEPFDFKIDNFAIGVILAFMLTGSLPFRAASITQTLRNVMEGKYSLEQKTVLSSGARDLIQNLLQLDPKKRISLEAALEHEWFNLIDRC